MNKCGVRRFPSQLFLRFPTPLIFSITPIMAEKERKRKVLVIGAGPVGSLTALSLHKRGWAVEIWDTRDGTQFLLAGC